MKTAAERQRLCRERKKASSQCRQINMWISEQARQALTRIAQQQSLGLTEALNQLLITAGTSAIPKHEGSGPDGHATSDVESLSSEKLPEIRSALQNEIPTLQGTPSMTSSSNKSDRRYVQKSLF